MKRWIIVLFIGIFLSIFVGCDQKANNMSNTSVSVKRQQDIQNILKPEEVKEVIIQIGGDTAKEYTLESKENIVEVINVYQQLLNYKQSDTMCLSQDVKIQFKLSSGEIKSTVFRRIKPIDKYFANVFNSLEYKHLSLPIFKVNKDQINKVKFESSKKIYSFESTDRNIIESSFKNVIKHYETTNYYGPQNFYEIGHVYFYDKNNKEIARGLILRSDSQWNELYNQNQSIRKMKVNTEDISQIIVSDKKAGKEVVVTDDQLKQKVLDSYYDGKISQSVIDVQLDFKIKNTNNASLYGSYLKGQIPDFIIELLK